MSGKLFSISVMNGCFHQKQSATGTNLNDSIAFVGLIG